MAFAKVECSILNHPKFQPLCSGEQGLAALGLWTLGLAYSMEQLSDGRVEKQWLLGRVRANTLRRSAELLVNQGLWHDHGDYYLIHDYDQWNLTSQQVKEEREAARERMRALRGGKPRSGEQHTGVRANRKSCSRQEVEVDKKTTTQALPVRANSTGPITTEGFSKHDPEAQRLCTTSPPFRNEHPYHAHRNPSASSPGCLIPRSE